MRLKNQCQFLVSSDVARVQSGERRVARLVRREFGRLPRPEFFPSARGGPKPKPKPRRVRFRSRFGSSLTEDACGEKPRRGRKTTARRWPNVDSPAVLVTFPPLSRAGLAKKGAFEGKSATRARASSERQYAPRDARDRPSARAVREPAACATPNAARSSSVSIGPRARLGNRKPTFRRARARTPRAFTFRHARVLRPRVGAGLPRREAPTHPAQDGRAPQLPRERIARYGETRAWPRRARRRASGMRFSRVDRFSSLFPRVRLTRAPSRPLPPQKKKSRCTRSSRR